MSASHGLPERKRSRRTGRKKAEEQHRKRINLLARAEQVANMGSWEWDIRTNELHWSEQAYKIFGLSRDEYEPSYESFHDFVHPDDRALFDRAVNNALQGQPYHVEFRIILSDSSVRHLLSQGDVDFDHDGKPTRMIGIVMDLTERKATEARLAYMASFPENNPNPIVEADVDGRVRYANPSALRLFPDIQDKGSAHPWLVGWEDVVRSIREGEASVSHRDVQVGGRVFHQVIQYRPQEAVARTYGMDTTERKRAEAQVSRSQKTFSELVERAPFGIYIVDSQFRIAQMNAGSQAGAFRNVRPVIGRDFAEAMRILWPEPVAAQIIASFRHTLETGEPYYSPRFVNPRHDVETVEAYEWELHRMTLPEGQYGVICYYFDSTKLREAEAALRKQAEILNRVSDAVFEVDSNNVITAWSSGAERMYGWTAADAIGRNGRELLMPEYSEPDRDAALERLWATGALELELIQATKDGRKLNVDIRATAARDEKGNPDSVVVLSRDVTERKRAETESQKLAKALSEEKDRLSALLNSIQDEVWYADQEKELTLINPAVLKEFNSSLVIGESIESIAAQFEVFRADGTLRSPDEAPPLRALRGETLSCEEIVRTPASGELRYRQVSAAPVRDAAGQIIGSVSVVRDITERKRAEEAIRKSEQRYRGLFESLPESVVLYRYILDDADQIVDFIFEDVNAETERATGIKREDFICRSFTQIFGSELIKRYIPYVNEMRRENKPVSYEDPENYVDQLGKYFVSRYVPLDASRFIALSIDLTERRRAEVAIEAANEQLKKADRHKNEFLAMLAHELRNPLAAISNAIELLKLRGSPDPMLKHARDAAARQTAHMAHLLDDLLDVARVTQGKVTLNKQEVPLASILESAIEASNPVMNARKHQLYVSHPREPMLVDGDRVRLSQAIGNLLHNSAKFTPPEGEIYLVVEREGDQAVILVRDNGKGIEPDLLPNVFELFVQGSRTLDRSDGGLGVGLTLVRSIVELHGGRVDARSEGPGCGSEFRIWLPLLPADERRAETGVGKAEESKSLRILVVDDNRDSADLLSALLEIEGHRVVAAYSGAEAIDLALKQLPEVALVDLGMPGMDGYELARRLRNSPELSNMALIAVSGYGQPEDIKKSRDTGFHDHLVKPVDLETLGRVLSGVKQ